MTKGKRAWTPKQREDRAYVNFQIEGRLKRKLDRLLKTEGTTMRAFLTSKIEEAVR